MPAPLFGHVWQLDARDSAAQLLVALPTHLQHHLSAHRFTRQELVNMAWSMAALDMEEATLLNGMLKALQVTRAEVVACILT